MAPDSVMLTVPGLPEPDDPGLRDLLALLSEAAGGVAVELRLSVDGSTIARTYRTGKLAKPVLTVNLASTELFKAELSLAAGHTWPGSLTAIAAFALEKTLLQGKLRVQAALLRSALDSTAGAVLLFDPDGEIVYANPNADRLLSRQTEDGLVVKEHAERARPLFTLLCSLVERIAHAEDGQSSWLGTLAVSDGSVLSCEITSLRRAGGQGLAGVMVRLQTADAVPDHRVGAFALSFRLSQREQEVVRLLCEGLQAPDIADRLGISRHTVRDHMKSLYRKTGSSSRSDLLNLVASATCAPPLDA